jgi:DNA polymerase III sliding clamp (beta) subunit (PCNA family)
MGQWCGARRGDDRMRDALEAIGTSQVGLEITGPSSPGVVKPVGENNGYLHVIMPMQVGGSR